MKTGKKARSSVFISNFRAGYSEKYQEKRTLYLDRKSSKIIYAFGVAIISFMVGLFAGRVFAPTSSTSAVSSEGVGIESESRPENTVKTAKTTLEKASEQEITTSANIIRPTYNLEIPSVGIYTNISTTYVNENNDIVVPASGVALLNSYKGRHFNLLVGHRASTFKNLGYLNYGDTINYYGTTYRVTSIYQQPISEVNMYYLTANSSALKLITCAGANNSERLIIEALPE